MRKTALRLCERLGARLTGLASSWAPFVVVAASLLKRGGRLAFVVPAEIGYAPYAQPVVRFLFDNFSDVHVAAVREKGFPDLSEAVWFLYASGFGKPSDGIGLSSYNSFRDVPGLPPRGERIGRTELKSWNNRLRPFLLSRAIRGLYSHVGRMARLGDCARVGIGYVTGANDLLVRRWSHPLVALSCEIEGHPLGGGLLKLEPREAARVVLPALDLPMSKNDQEMIEEGVGTLRRWRLHA